MDAAPSLLLPGSDPVVVWRYGQAVRLGYDRLDCFTVAFSRLDLHELAALISAGCSLELALDILA